jgi:predicted choloylglycine hydrolase
MLIVDIAECRGTAFDVGFQNAGAFMATPRGKTCMRRKKTKPHVSFRFSDAETAFKRTAPNLWMELEGMAVRLDLPLKQVVQDFGNFTLRYPRTGCSAAFSGGLYARTTSSPA